MKGRFSVWVRKGMCISSINNDQNIDDDNENYEEGEVIETKKDVDEVKHSKAKKS